MEGTANAIIARATEKPKPPPPPLTPSAARMGWANAGRGCNEHTLRSVVSHQRDVLSRGAGGIWRSGVALLRRAAGCASRWSVILGNRRVDWSVGGISRGRLLALIPIYRGNVLP